MLEDFAVDVVTNYTKLKKQEIAEGEAGFPVAVLLQIAIAVIPLIVERCDSKENLIKRAKNPSLLDKVRFTMMLRKLCNEDETLRWRNSAPSLSRSFQKIVENRTELELGSIIDEVNENNENWWLI